MSITLTISSLVIAFIVTAIAMPFWIRGARRAKLTGTDKHKPENKQVAEVGGLPVVCGFLIALLYYIATRVFLLGQQDDQLLFLLAAIVSILIAAIIGIVDDILGWKIGLRIRYKIILTFFIALPIMVVNAGVSHMNIPILGVVELGLIYPLLIIPFGIMGASNGFNMLAGYNGLEAGLGIIILSTLGVIAYATGAPWVGVIAFSMVFSLIAFFMYNKNPAKVFPGDTLTYSVGAVIAIVAILGNIEKFALILFIPYYFEFFLKARGRMKMESFAKLNEDGTLDVPYSRFYGLEHITIAILKRIKKKVTENNVVYFILFFQLMIAGITLMNFFFWKI